MSQRTISAVISRSSLFLTLVGSVTAFTSVAHAEAPQAAVPEPHQRENSININPLGVAFGNYNLNYERLFGGSHGLLLEGGFSRASDDNSSTKSFGGGVGYRWHWRGQQNSGFLGLQAAFYKGSGEGSVTSGGAEKNFNLDIKSYSLTANIGKRWAWDNGLNVTFRIGGGYGNHEVSTDSNDPDAKELVEDVNDLLTLFPIAIDGELSLGYNF